MSYRIEEKLKVAGYKKIVSIKQGAEFKRLYFKKSKDVLLGS